MSNFARIRAIVICAGLLPGLHAPRAEEVSRNPSHAGDVAGAYRWDSGRFVDIIEWDEFDTGWVAFDDSGWVRALTPTGARSFSAGPGSALAEPVVARIQFEPAEPSAPAQSLVWAIEGMPPRIAQRSEDALSEDVYFNNGTTRLAGTLLLPTSVGPHPALVLLHGSGPQDRNGTLPFARFLVRQGIAILGFDKRGVGASQGDWRRASFETLADDALAAVAYLKSRRDVDPGRIGLFGVSQGGWIGPLAASRSADVALVVSVSAPGVTPAEQTLDLIEAELRFGGVPEPEVAEAVQLTQLAFHYGRTRSGWDEYARALARSRERPWFSDLGLADDPNHNEWEQQQLFYHYDPAPALAALRCPLLVLLAEKDSGIPIEKNRRRWREALERGQSEYQILVVPGANHIMFGAKTGSLSEIPNLDGFAADYRRILLEWLRARFALQGP